MVRLAHRGILQILTNLALKRKNDCFVILLPLVQENLALCYHDIMLSLSSTTTALSLSPNSTSGTPYAKLALFKAKT